MNQYYTPSDRPTNRVRPGSSNHLKRSLSAALLASAIMAGSTFADDITAPAQISNTRQAVNVTVAGGNAITVDTASGPNPTINASGKILVSEGSISGVDMSGKASFQKTTTGTVTIQAGTKGSSWTGATTIEAGKLVVGGFFALSDQSDTTLSKDATLELQGVSILVLRNFGDGTNGGGSVIVNPGSLFAVNIEKPQVTFSGTFEGPTKDASLYKIGAGNWILTGNSDDFIGTLGVLEGVMQLGDGTTGSMGTLEELEVDHGQFILNLADDGILSANRVNLGEDGVFVAAATGINTIETERLVSAATSTFIQGGNGKTILLGEYDFQGGVRVEAGTLQLGTNTATATLIKAVPNSEEEKRQGQISISKVGTLEIHNIGTEPLRNTLANDGTIVVNSTGTTAIESDISGTGQLVVNGPSTGVTEFRGKGKHTYSGATIVTTGSMKATGDNILSSRSAFEVRSGAKLDVSNTSQAIGSLAGAGIVNLTQASLSVGHDNTSTTFSGVLFDGTGADAGSLSKAGTGTFIIEGVNAIGGGVFINGGTLQLGTASSIGDLGNSLITIAAPGILALHNTGSAFNKTIVNNGAIILNGPGTLNSINSTISGTGQFIINGPFNSVTNLYGQGQYTYSGATIVKTGTLVAMANGVLSSQSAVHLDADALLDLTGTTQTIGSLNGAGDVFIHDGLLTVGSDNRNAYFSGSIAHSLPGGTAGVDKIGTGTWTVDGANLYTGNTDIKAGAIILGSTAGSSASLVNDVFVRKGATFGGHGTVGGDVESWGVVAPGAKKKGRLSIGGDYTQHDSATLVTRVESATNHDQLAIAGNADIKGRLLIDGSDNVLRPGEKITFLTTGGTVTGTFDKVDSTMGAMIGYNVLYDIDAIDLELYQKAFTGLPGLSGTGQKIAKALDQLITEKKGGKLIDHLNSGTLDVVTNEVENLSPEAYASIFNIGFSTTLLQTGNIERRLSDARGGARGFSTNGLALSNNRGTLNYDGMPIANDRDGLTLAGYDGEAIASTLDFDSRWGFFITGTGEWSKIDSSTQVHGGDFTTGGVTIGADYRVSENLIVGLSGSYANTGSEFWNNGTLDVNSGRGTLYATVFSGGAYLNALVGGGYSSYKSRYDKIGGTAHGDTGGGEFNSLLGGGYDFQIGDFTVGPIGSVQYTYIGLSSFTETGSYAPMAIASTSQNSLRSTLGARATYAFVMGETIIRPEIRAQWAHEFLDSTSTIEASFAAGGGAFVVNGQNNGRDGFLVDAGVSVEFSPSYSVFAYYTGEIGRTNYSSNGVNGGFRINF